MNKKTSKEIVILGMHRSGTSMLSGMLNRLGVDMGDDKPGRQVSNPMGHYEDGVFLSLNESILNRAGGSWDNPPAEREIKKQANHFQEKIRKAVQKKHVANIEGAWGWKDPRTSLTIQLYLPFLDNLHLIWCERDPEDISKSLWKRNKIPHQESLDLIEHYQQQISNFIEGHQEFPVLKISYQEIVEKPEYWINKVVEFLDIDPDEDQLRAAVRFILPTATIQRERKILWWNYVLSLPGKALRKIKIIK